MIARWSAHAAAKSLQRPARYGRLRSSSSQLGQAFIGQLVGLSYPDDPAFFMLLW